MALPGETIATGGRDVCPDCQTELHLQVLSTPAGYYIGTFCDCGPYSRETDYFPTLEEAQQVLDAYAKAQAEDNEAEIERLEMLFWR